MEQKIERKEQEQEKRDLKEKATNEEEWRHYDDGEETSKRTCT